MGHSGWFSAATAGPEWQLHPELAAVSEAARLTVREAQVVLLYTLGFSTRTIGRVLGIRRYRAVVWRHLRRAVRKFRGVRPDLIAAQRQWILMLLECQRNRQSSSNPKPPLIGEDDYGRPKTWCYAARPYGTVPEDLMPRNSLSDFLLALAEALKQERMWRAIARRHGLDDQAQMALIYTHVHHLPLAETARRLAIDEASAYALLNRAKEALGPQYQALWAEDAVSVLT